MMHRFSLAQLSALTLLLFLVPACSSTSPSRHRRLPRAVSTADHASGSEKEVQAASHAADPAQVARRALVLRALSAADLFPRADEIVSSEALSRYEVERAKLVKWLEEDGAWEEATEREKAFLSSKVGTPLRSGAEVERGDRESLLVMLWALGLVKNVPSYDSGAPSMEKLARQLPEVGEPTAKFIQEARLRPEEEIEREWEKAEIWHWRARAREVLRDRMFPQGKELDSQVQDLEEKAQEEGFRLGPIRDGETFFKELIRFASSYAHREKLIPAPLDEDFPAMEKRYSDLTDQEFERVRRIAQRRHHSLGWILGRGDD